MSRLDIALLLKISIRMTRMKIKNKYYDKKEFIDHICIPYASDHDS